ncbi:hypothetical protein H072_8645 [Dactylellina haptotyla CBS 200.50]|uniref:Uncharacterized protein n=1 Tax=Dactylellina haptotyla (strain CBS 200.50) TaxID=1284197 RepID=S8BEG4_DACHA|nr:hypothetical protein H072_8645 [Dactylellina haptotyla CBS 200.50]
MNRSFLQSLLLQCALYLSLGTELTSALPTPPESPKPVNLPFKSDQSINPRVDIHPSFFYHMGQMFVLCTPPGLLHHIQEITNPEGHVDDPFTPYFRNREIETIFNAQSKCHKCTCTTDGVMLPQSNPSPGVDVVEVSCPNQEWVEKCINEYYCYCTANLKNAQKTVPGAELQDYLNALQNLPIQVKFNHPNYQWMEGLAGLEAMWNLGHRWDEPMQRSQQARHRRLAPGIKEPYYLEGPDPPSSRKIGSL